MGCRCCRMIKRYIFGPAIVELPSTVRNEINCKNNDIKHETTFHNNKDKTNNIVASTLDKVINLEEQDAEIEIRESNASKKNIVSVQNKIAEDVKDNANNDATNMLNNNQVHQVSSGAAAHPTDTNNCSSYNIKAMNKNEQVHPHGSGTENDCPTVNRLSTHCPAEVSAVALEEEKVADNHEIANMNNDKLPSRENDEVYQNNLETDLDEIKVLSNPSSNENPNALNGHKDLESTRSAIDGEFIRSLLEEKFRLEFEDAEVAAALAALEAATAGEDDELED
ncbi:3',5'-cyclic-AMP phosphodiesterase 4-like [Mobula hypostoma]|uniref:3',5'-cyclic-AMP phosphodiesterase 4-like n=1 Tax=Mobula hypostoma TaxID=723540 RepID=UPI002FC2DAE6